MLWDLKWHDYGKVIMFAEAISIFASANMLWEMRPKFAVKSKVLGIPVITHSGMSKMVGA
jgi:hypothetical protein